VIYLDANIIIRFVEGDPIARAPLKVRLAPFTGIRGSMITSRISRLECRSKPLGRGATAILQEFDIFFSGFEAQLLDVSNDVLEKATELRAAYNFKTPDAIHLATAILSGCPSFLTGDKSLARCGDIAVEVL